MSKVLNICLSCGFCCDGSMIGFVKLESDERSTMRELMDIEEVDEKGLFFQPCSNICHDGCSIYSQRPKQCRNFKCDLLNSIEKKELGFDSAMEVINILQQKKKNIDNQLATLQLNLQSKSFYFKIVEFTKLLGKDNSTISLTQKHQELISDINEFDKLLSKSFGISFYC